MKKKWHYTKDNEFPKVFGKYEKDVYPQIPCVVEIIKPYGYGIRYWNVTEECWDDEECDDFFCNKENVSRWMYLDALTEKE